MLPLRSAAAPTTQFSRGCGYVFPILSPETSLVAPGKPTPNLIPSHAAAITVRYGLTRKHLRQSLETRLLYSSTLPVCPLPCYPCRPPSSPGSGSCVPPAPPTPAFRPHVRPVMSARDPAGRAARGPGTREEAGRNGEVRSKARRKRMRNGCGRKWRNS